MSDRTQAMRVGEDEPVVVADRYRLVELIGRGGTAEVWRAEDEALDRSVALKLVTVPTDDSAARAGEEARLLARLNHPGLVPVYDAGTDDRDRPWVVMELVEGETLSDTLKRGPVDPQRTAAIGSSVAAALGYVHAQNLVHRDVKPGNILMGQDGRVRLTDFGIARLVDAARVTSTGMMVGTASYLAPEQVAGEPVGPPADVYALGLVLLECLTGQREYAGSTVEVALARLQRQPDVPADLPDGWTPLLQAMTAREPTARPAPGRAATDLAEIAAGGQATTVLAAAPVVERTTALPRTAVAPQARVAQPAYREEPRPVALPRRNATPYVLLLLGIVAALVAGFLFANRSTSLDDLPEVNRELPPAVQEDLDRLKDTTDRITTKAD